MPKGVWAIKPKVEIITLNGKNDTRFGKLLLIVFTTLSNYYTLKFILMTELRTS